jgi:alkylation response protein AidB-like acyl-CoA dehydrogenase
MTRLATASLPPADLPEPAAPLSADFIAEVRSGASRRDAERILPFDIIDQMKTLRFGARRLARHFGGEGISIAQALGEVIDLAAADPNVAHIWRNHLCIVQRLNTYRGGHGHVDYLIAEVAKGRLLSLAGTELTRAQTGGASPFSATLTPQGDGLVMNGRKFYSTGVIYADHIQSAAVDAEGKNTGFIVPRDREGLEIVDDWTGMGQRLTGTGTTIFTNVPVRHEEVSRPEDFAPSSQPLSSTVAQLTLTAVIAGVLAEIARDSIELVRSRSRTYYFAPSPLAKDDPILLQALGEREADAYAARAVVLAAAAEIDAADAAIAAGQSDAQTDALAQAASAAAARAKVVVDRIAHLAGAALYDVGGASSTLTEKNFDRHWRNLRTISSHNPASYKAYALGNRALNGAELPRIGFF